METNKKRFLVIWTGLTILSMTGLYYYYKEDDNSKDKLVIPKGGNLEYDDKLTKLRKDQDKSSVVAPTFTVADSIKTNGVTIENPIKAEQKQVTRNVEKRISQINLRQQEAVAKFEDAYQNTEGEEPIRHYKPKGDRIIYKEGKAFVNGVELKDDKQQEETPAAFKKAAGVVEEISKNGTPKSYDAPQYNLSDGVIPCVVHTTQVVKNGTNVTLRTTKEASMGAIKIPRNTLLSATAKYNNDRVNLIIKYMKIDGNFYTVNMVGLGDDGNEGLPLSSSVELQVVSNEVGNAVVNEASSILSGLGVAGRAVGSIARGVNSATKSQKQREIKLITNQKINFVSYEN